MPAHTNAKRAEEPSARLLAQIEEALPSQVQTPDKLAMQQTATRDIQQALTRLSARTPRFRCTGVCRLGVHQDGHDLELLLPIRSVPFEVTMRLVEEAYVEPPRQKKMNIETMEFEMVKDEHDPAYQQKLQQANTLFLKRYTLYALDCELEDEQGQIVWSPQQGSGQQEAAALRVLETQGLTQTHYLHIREQAEALSMTEQQQQEARRLRTRS